MASYLSDLFWFGFIFGFVFLAENFYTFVWLLTHTVIVCIYVCNCGGKYKTFEELLLQGNLTCM